MHLHRIQSLAVVSLCLVLLAGCEAPRRVPQVTVFPQTTNKKIPLPIIQPGHPPPATFTSPFHAEKLKELDAVVEAAIADKKLPGGVLWLEKDTVAYRKDYGKRAVVPQEELMSENTIFDAASLTKVIAATPAIMRLIEQGKVSLDDRVVKYIPEFGTLGKEVITVRQLLTHTSGLRPDVGLKPDWNGYDAAIRLACEEKLSAPPGTKIIYSDTGLYLVGEIVRRVSGLPLDQFVQREVFGPLGMSDTGFNPPRSKLARIAPTEVENGVPVRGIVQIGRAHV